MARATKATDPKKQQVVFLDAMKLCGNITKAAKVAGIDRGTHYIWMNKYPDYAKEFEVATEQATDLLEQEARRRAVEGTDEPVFYKGEECGYIRKYSDTLLIFLLKGARPDKYRENIKQEITGKDGGPIETTNKPDLTKLSIEELRQLAELTRKAAGTS